MKTLLILFVSTTLVPLSLYGQTHTEEIKRTLQFAQADSDNMLILKNISGDVRVVGYDGDELRLTVQKKVRADNQEDLARAQEEVQLVTDVDSGVAWVYLEAPFIKTKRKGRDLHFQMRRDDDDYHFRFDFTVEVPRQTNLRVGTINEGEVSVENIDAQKIEVNNINGPIRCASISGTTRAQTINGEIDITYAEAPTEKCSYQTINGEITVRFPEDLSADVRFKSMHGDLFTDFPNVAYLPAQVQTDQSQSGQKTTYRIDKSTQVRIGDGGPRLDFEVLNGSVYLRQL